MEKYYYLYMTTNRINNKIYVGVHETFDIDDGYMGSGKILLSAIQKYGLDSFKTEILERFENREAMYEMERLVVDQAFVLRQDTYNLKIGGSGGWDYVIKRGLNNKRSADYKYNHSQETKDKMREAHRIRLEEGLYKNGTLLYSSEEYLRLIGKGMIWVSKDDKQVRIDPDLLDEYLNAGYIKGRFFINEDGEQQKFSPSKGNYWVNKGENDNHFISENELNEYLEKGYQRGNAKSIFRKQIFCKYGKDNHMSEKIWINKDTKSKVILPDDLNNYLIQGWSKGKYQRPGSGPKKKRTQS